jgi:hypothetical protein
MNFNEFSAQIARLRIAYGDKSMNPEKVNLLWRRFEKNDPETFKQCVDHILLNCRAVPMLEEFYAGFNSAKTHTKKANDCEMCASSGWILPDGPDYQKDEEARKTAVAMRCDCSGGVVGIVSHFRRPGIQQDLKLADRIEENFRNVSCEEYKKYGFKIKDGKIHPEAYPRRDRQPTDTRPKVSCYSEQDQRDMMKTMRLRVSGKITDDAWEKFQADVKNKYDKHYNQRRGKSEADLAKQRAEDIFGI